MQKQRVLIVGSQQDSCELYQDFLDAYGYTAIATTNPCLATSILPVFCPDLLILPYWTARDKHMADFVASCQYNYPIVFVCIWYDTDSLGASPFFNEADIILVQPLSIKELLQAVRERLAIAASD